MEYIYICVYYIIHNYIFIHMQDILLEAPKRFLNNGPPGQSVFDASGRSMEVRRSGGAKWGEMAKWQGYNQRR